MSGGEGLLVDDSSFLGGGKLVSSSLRELTESVEEEDFSRIAVGSVYAMDLGFTELEAYSAGDDSGKKKKKKVRDPLSLTQGVALFISYFYRLLVCFVCRRRRRRRRVVVVVVEEEEKGKVSLTVEMMVKMMMMMMTEMHSWIV